MLFSLPWAKSVEESMLLYRIGPKNIKNEGNPTIVSTVLQLYDKFEIAPIILFLIYNLGKIPPITVRVHLFVGSIACLN